jgi:hypothetical protein
MKARRKAGFSFRSTDKALLVEEACAGSSVELHEMAIRDFFPRISRVVHSADVGFATV